VFPRLASARPALSDGADPMIGPPMADASSPQRLQLQLLALPRLLRDGEPVHVGSRKAMAILALLALERGGTRTRLATLLWPEADTAVGRRNLRRELFRLRELGVPLGEAGDGALALDPGIEVDALRLLADAHLPDAGGLAFDGLDGVGSVELDAWLQQWRETLAERHARALDRAAQALEARGDRIGALALRQRAAAADPLHEGAALHVVRLKAALGDRAGALQAFQRFADALRDELDIAPSAPALAIAQSLRGDAGAGGADGRDAAVQRDDAEPVRTVASSHAAACMPGAASHLPSLVPFVPRPDSQQRIEAAWARGQRVYLHGPAGSGKTRLASELAAARGPWLRVACEPQDAELPYSSVVRLLRALRDSAPAVVLPDWVRRELAALMPELGDPPTSLATDEARQRLLAAVAEAWRLLMHDNFSALVLDDWHWGDRASVELWSRLDDTAPASAGSIAWIVAYRSAQLPAGALARQRADLDDRRGVAVALEGLSEVEVLELTRVLSGAGGGRLFSQRLHRATEGNPFFLLETLRHLFDRGLLSAGADGWSTPFDASTESYAELPVPSSVRDAVLARVRALGAPVQRLLEVASLGGGEIDARLLAAVGGLDEEAVIDGLEHAAAAQLVHETDAGWRFSHDLVRQSLFHGLSSGRRRLLHEKLARGLEASAAAPALVAVHWEAAGRAEAAVRWRVSAGEAAARVHAPDEALSHLAQALADGAAGAVAASIHLACADLHRRRADRPAADAAFVAAAAAAAADPVDGPQAVLGVQLAHADHLCLTDRTDTALAALDALAPELAAAPPALRAKALTVRGSGLMRQGRFAAAEAALAEAEALLRELPERRRDLAALVLDLARSSNWRGDTPAWGRHARRAVAVYESVDDPAGLASALSVLSLYHKYVGERDQALATGERARALAARCGDVPAHRSVNFSLLQVLMDSGHTDQVLALLDEAEALAPAFENDRTARNFRAARFFVHFLRGEVAEAKAAGQRLLDVDVWKENPVSRVGMLHMVSDLYVDLGDWARARALVDEAQALCEAQKAAGDAIWFSDNHAIKQATLALAEGRPADAMTLLATVDSDEIDIRFHVAYLGAAAARAVGDGVEAQRRLDSVSIDEAAPAHPLACWLEQRLLLAAAQGRRDAAAAACAEAQLADGRVPVLLVERLRRALDA
jgi:DNA-binding SARP family transcriptional activator